MSEILRNIGNLDPRTGYTARVRAYNRFGVPSDWSEAISFNTGDISVPGAIPTVYVAAAAHTIMTQWSAVTDAAFDHYEIYVNTAANFTPDANHLVASPSGGTTYPITKYWNGSALVDLLIAKTYYIQMYWVDGSNNKTLMGTEVSATTGISNNEDGIQAALIVADRIATGTLLAAYTLSGTIKTGDTGARMELDSDGFRGYASNGTTKSIEYKTSDGSVTVLGNISGGTIDIGGDDTSSFHVDASGNMWLGKGIIDFATAPFRVTSAGVLTATSGTFSGALSGATGTFAGSLSAATGTFSGSLSAATGTFSGSLSAATGTFSGNVSGGTIDIGGADSTSFHVDSTGAMWLGNASFASAPFKVSAAGALTATTGTFTNGDISGTDITGSTITGSQLQTGISGARVVISSSTYLSGTDDIKIYSNNANASSNPAQISITGAASPFNTQTLSIGSGSASSQATASISLAAQNSVAGSTATITAAITSLSGTLTVSGVTTLNSTLTVSSTATFNGNIVGNGSNNSLGTTTVFGTLGVSSTATFAGAIAGNAGSGSAARLRTRGGGNNVSFDWAGGSFNIYVDDTPQHVIYPGTKTFIINHPKNKDKYLIHACIEGPENAVYYRGQGQLSYGQAWIKLPDYFESLTYEQGRTVQITPLANGLYNQVDDVYATYPLAGEVGVGSSNKGSMQRFFWEVKAVRKDVAPPIIEPNKDEINVQGNGPYKFYSVR